MFFLVFSSPYCERKRKQGDRLLPLHLYMPPLIIARLCLGSINDLLVMFPVAYAKLLGKFPVAFVNAAKTLCNYCAKKLGFFYY